MNKNNEFLDYEEIEFPAPNWEMKDEPEAVQEQAQKKPKPSQADRLRRQNDELVQELNRLKNENLSLNKKVLDVETTKLELLNTNVSWAKKLAAEDNDSQTEMDAEKHLKKIEREFNELEREKDRIAQQEQNYHRSSVSSESERLMSDFLARNPLINFKDPTNPNYSPKAYQIAQDASERLSMKYKMSGRGEEEFSEGYFQELEQQFKKEIGMVDNSTNNYNRRNFSSPVSNNNMNQNYSYGREPQLSREAQETMNGFMALAKTDEQKKMLRKRYMDAARNNYQNPNINSF